MAMDPEAAPFEAEGCGMAMDPEAAPFRHEVVDLVGRAGIEHVLENIVGFYINRHGNHCLSGKIIWSRLLECQRGVLPKNTTSSRLRIVSLTT